MIAANELRIGNWVNYDNGDTPFCVIEIAISGISVKNSEEETWIEIEQFSPILLTPKILEKCGFVKLRNNWSENVPDTFKINLLSLNNGDGILNLILNAVNAPCPKVQYLHQLQNIYFCLCEEELIINL